MSSITTLAYRKTSDTSQVSYSSQVPNISRVSNISWTSK